MAVAPKPVGAVFQVVVQVEHVLANLLFEDGMQDDRSRPGLLQPFEHRQVFAQGRGGPDDEGRSQGQTQVGRGQGHGVTS